MNWGKSTLNKQYKTSQFCTFCVFKYESLHWSNTPSHTCTEDRGRRRRTGTCGQTADGAMVQSAMTEFDSHSNQMLKSSHLSLHVSKIHPRSTFIKCFTIKDMQDELLFKHTNVQIHRGSKNLDPELKVFPDQDQDQDQGLLFDLETVPMKRDLIFQTGRNKAVSSEQTGRSQTLHTLVQSQRLLTSDACIRLLINTATE